MDVVSMKQKKTSAPSHSYSDKKKKSYSTLLTFYILKRGYAIDKNSDVP